MAVKSSGCFGPGVQSSEDMNPAVRELVKQLSLGKAVATDGEGDTGGPIDHIARVYEVARNALEYRAEHLVRRAAIERILKRQLVFESDTRRLSESLLLELKWAKYVTWESSRPAVVEEIKKIFDKYFVQLKSPAVDREWLVGLISAEIEEYLNPSKDYYKFTNFAFHCLKKALVSQGLANFDLILYTAIDKIYSQSDNQQLAYHLFRLISNQSGKSDHKVTDQILAETYNHTRQAINSPQLNRVAVAVRKLVGPLVLVRDIYFSGPEEFAQIINDEKMFKERAGQVLAGQLALLRGRMSTAGMRSLIYVFLTKMLFALILEIPVDRWIRGEVAWGTLAVNTLFPVGLMWSLTANIKLPDTRNQERLVLKAWEVVSRDDLSWVGGEQVHLLGETLNLKTKIFYTVYMVLGMAVFAGITVTLVRSGFSLVSSVIFLFFVTVVSFFAYRIRQTAKIYTVKSGRGLGSSLGDMLMLPIVTVGSWLSRGVAKLNFLVFVFDFVLEAPFKMILRVMDNWFDFLSRKKDEVVG
ncbi:MAG: hypothetical protein UY33_C0018G0010 [Candidatus Amesbacteria bacterium GW2011_GWA1_48_9]|uniref:Uncharacterized protein n=1 Tax=Candidatus Amesbacteria bacterium GW2011_GWA1_48_9 TaxID=1618355 RepID=A0A0G1V0P3_9BACT|nr:MAG: hypothetical protein UY33_C0018G0010 [Candidatus Amesbacteria bacterium GW2011_GWA1_48_9]